MAWMVVGSMKGPAGDAGPAGPAGPPGPPGPEGPARGIDIAGRAVVVGVDDPGLQLWIGTAAQYAVLGSRDVSTVYVVVPEGASSSGVLQ